VLQLHEYVYCCVLWVVIDGGNSILPLWRYQLWANAARRAAWLGQAVEPARVGVVTRSVWPQSPIEGRFSSLTYAAADGSRPLLFWCNLSSKNLAQADDSDAPRTAFERYDDYGTLQFCEQFMAGITRSAHGPYLSVYHVPYLSALEMSSSW